MIPTIRIRRKATFPISIPAFNQFLFYQRTHDCYLCLTRTEILTESNFLFLKSNTSASLEPKLLEEPLVLSSLVSLLKLGLDLSLSLSPESWIPEGILVDQSLVQVDINRVTTKSNYNSVKNNPKSFVNQNSL